MKKKYSTPSLSLLHVGSCSPLAASGSAAGPGANDQEDPTAPQRARATRHSSIWDDEEEH